MSATMVITAAPSDVRKVFDLRWLPFLLGATPLVIGGAWA